MRAPRRLTSAAAAVTLAVALFSAGTAKIAIAGSDGDLVLDSYISSASCTPDTTNCASGTTGVTSHGGGLVYRAEAGNGLEGFSHSGDIGVEGFSQGATSVGVDGEGHVGVHANGTGDGGIGVSAEGNDYAVFATGTETAIYGLGLTADGVKGEAGDKANGVFGRNFGSGVGVRGSSTDGTGVVAKSSSGTALRVLGRAQFSRSGTAVVHGTGTNPRSSVVVSNVAIGTRSLVLATPQKNLSGVFVQAAVPNASANTVTIFLNRKVSTDYPVAWMVIENP